MKAIQKKISEISVCITSNYANRTLYANVEYFNCPYFTTVCPHCYPLFYDTNRSELKVKLGMMRY